MHRDHGAFLHSSRVATETWDGANQWQPRKQALCEQADVGWRSHEAGSSRNAAGGMPPPSTLTTADDELAPARPPLLLPAAAACRASAFVWMFSNSSKGSASAEHRKRTLQLRGRKHWAGEN